MNSEKSLLLVLMEAAWMLLILAPILVREWVVLPMALIWSYPIDLTE